MDHIEFQENWDLWGLISHLAERKVFSIGTLFRGQSDASWELVPALYRRPVDIFSPGRTIAETYLRAEEDMLQAFFDRATILLPRFRRSPLVDRIFAQHYGVPTQLLDWSLDPLVALFFAVQGDDLSKDCALFFIKPLSGFMRQKTDITLPYSGRISEIIPPTIDERIRVQKSMFTIQSFGDSEKFTPLDRRPLMVSEVGEDLQPSVEVGAFGKVIIPARKRRGFLLQLLSLGVDNSLIYPGLQGIGQRINDMAKLLNYSGPGF